MAFAALEEQYGQPNHPALQEIQCILKLPRVPAGNTESFQRFAVRVSSMIGMLQSLGPNGRAELACASHELRLLSKLPSDYSRYALQ